LASGKCTLDFSLLVPINPKFARISLGKCSEKPKIPNLPVETKNHLPELKFWHFKSQNTHIWPFTHIKGYVQKENILTTKKINVFVDAGKIESNIDILIDCRGIYVCSK